MKTSDIMIGVQKALELGINTELKEIFNHNYRRLTENELQLDRVPHLMLQLISSFAKTKDLFHNAWVEKKDKGKIEFMGEYIYNLNYSISLSFDYLVTLMNISNINDEDILKYYKTLMSERDLTDAYYFEDNALKTVMCFARHNNIERHVYNNPDINLRPSIHFEQSTYAAGENFLKPGRIVNDIYGELIWKNTAEIIHHISKSYLKFLNIQSVESDVSEYHKEIMEVWLHFFCLMDLWGNDYDSIGRIYSVINYIKNNPTNE